MSSALPSSQVSPTLPPLIPRPPCCPFPMKISRLPSRWFILQPPLPRPMNHHWSGLIHTPPLLQPSRPLRSLIFLRFLAFFSMNYTNFLTDGLSGESLRTDVEMGCTLLAQDQGFCVFFVADELQEIVVSLLGAEDVLACVCLHRCGYLFKNGDSNKIQRMLLSQLAIKANQGMKEGHFWGWNWCWLSQRHQQLYLMKLQKNKSILVSSHFRRNTQKGNLTPTKVLMGVTFCKKSSIKTLHNSTRQYQPKYSRLTHHSIEEVHLHHSKSVENAEQEREVYGKQEEGDGLFCRSYAKIQRMKSSMVNKKINDQLDDILRLIEKEKAKIRDSMKRLEQCNEYYRFICEGKKPNTEETSVNTEQFINDGIEAVYIDSSTQCTESQLKSSSSNPQKRQSKKVREAYNKLNTMLIDMNINPQQILPEESLSLDKAERSFKLLSDSQKIKIQQFFIKKLAAKLQK